jgi:hypothetical protein
MTKERPEISREDSWGTHLLRERLFQIDQTSVNPLAILNSKAELYHRPGRLKQAP